MTNETFAKIALHTSTISVSKPLANEIGLRESIILTELLSKFFYWKDRGHMTKDGYFFCTVEDLRYSTCIPKQSQINCIKKLVEMKLICNENRGMPARRYFSFTEENLSNFKRTITQGEERLDAYYKEVKESLDVPY